MAAKLKKFLLRYYPPGIILQYERDGVMKQKPIDLLDLTPDVDVEVRQIGSGPNILGRSTRLLRWREVLVAPGLSGWSQVLLSQIIRQEPLISENRRPALRQLIGRLIEKMQEQQHHSFTLFKVGGGWPLLHDAPCARALASGSGSVLPHAWWRSAGPPCTQVLRAHILPLTNCAFNKSGDRFITGSYDRTCKARPCLGVSTAKQLHAGHGVARHPTSSRPGCAPAVVHGPGGAWDSPRRSLRLAPLR